MTCFKAVAVGCGYFSRFHFEAWNRIPEVDLTAVCDIDESAATAAQDDFGIPRAYTSFEEMLEVEQPDFVDIITRPDTHLDLVTQAARRGIDLICQKPLAPAFEESQRIVEVAESASVRLMVHENFRFQPWYREIRRLLDIGDLGERLFSLSFVCRPGDGWGERAYLDRQPYFRQMPRFLLHETGIHFIDTFRYLAGDVSAVFAHLRRLNPRIAGEDCGLLLLEHDSGCTSLWDANRCNESLADNPRYTFGRLLVETDAGSLRLADDGTITIHPRGQTGFRHDYEHLDIGFAGDCVFATQRHFVDRLMSEEPFETGGREYLRNLQVLEAAYCSASEGAKVRLPPVTD